MGVRIGISLSDDTHAWAQALAAAEGESLSGFIDNVLRAEIARRGLADHAEMVRDATDATALRHRAAYRRAALQRWKTQQA
jgi:hypothetical protein